MHHSEIDPDIKPRHVDAELLERVYGDRPVLLGEFAPVDGCDVMVPVDGNHPEAVFLAFTREQAVQAMLILAGQVGKAGALSSINELP